MGLPHHMYVNGTASAGIQASDPGHARHGVSPSPNTRKHIPALEICTPVTHATTHTLIGSCVPVPRYISEQVLAIRTVNQACKTITDFSSTDGDTVELLIPGWAAPHCPQQYAPRHGVLGKCHSASCLLSLSGGPAASIRKLSAPGGPLPLDAPAHVWPSSPPASCFSPD